MVVVGHFLPLSLLVINDLHNLPVLRYILTLAFGRELGQKRSLQSWIMEFAETQIQKEGFHE